MQTATMGISKSRCDSFVLDAGPRQGQDCVKSFTPELKKLPEEAGCFFVRQGRGDHEIWESPISGIRFTVDNNIKSRHTANGVLKQAGLPKAF